MVKHHLIISGTGRTGTTYLMKLFTKLGLKTGFTEADFAVDKNANAGLEWGDILSPNAPYILKLPHFCDHLDAIAQRGDFIVDHAIVPMRDLYSAAESRREVVRNAGPGVQPSLVTGGLFGTDVPEQQERMLTIKLYQLMYAIAKHDIPLTLLLYPRLKDDPFYLFDKLAFMLQDISRATFLMAHESVYDPKAGHDFLRTQQPK
jgi:hypothetical protein